MSDDNRNYMNAIQAFLNANYKRNEITELARQLGCPKTSLFEWFEGRAPGFKNLIYIKKLAELHGLTLDEILFHNVKPKQSIVGTFSFFVGNKKYIIEIKEP